MAHGTCKGLPPRHFHDAMGCAGFMDAATNTDTAFDLQLFHPSYTLSIYPDTPVGKYSRLELQRRKPPASRHWRLIARAAINHATVHNEPINSRPSAAPWLNRPPGPIPGSWQRWLLFFQTAGLRSPDVV